MLYRVSERVYDGSIIPPESGNFISDENLFNYQAKVLRELLNEEAISAWAARRILFCGISPTC